LVLGAEKASRDQAGRAPRWRLLEARRPGVDIIAGASLARRTVNLPLSIVKIRLWLPGRFVVARSAAVSKKCCPLRGTEGSNPASSSGESCKPDGRGRSRQISTAVLRHKDDSWSFPHFDTITVSVADAPRPDEILVVMVIADGGRPRNRCGTEPIR
jgi:Amino acid synthesis